MLLHSPWHLSLSGKHTHVMRQNRRLEIRLPSTPLVYHMLALGGQKVCKLVEGASFKMQLFLALKMFYGSGQGLLDTKYLTRLLQQ